MRTAPTHLAILAVAGCLLLLPVLIYGFPAYSHDGWIHALWSENFSNQLWAGDLYPRWLAGLNRGLGSPAFFFYPPLPYYLTGLLNPFFSTADEVWWQLGVSAMISVIAAGGFAYLWLCRFVDRITACAGAILYTALPYHLIIDLYIRGAFAELFSFVWMPLILYFTSRLRENSPFMMAGVAVSYALLIFSHLPAALIFIPLPLGYAWFLEPGQKRRGAVLVLFSLGLGVGLSAIYLLPATTMRDFVSMEVMQQSKTYFENWFLFSTWSVRELGAQLSLMTAGSMILVVCFFAIAIHSKLPSVRRDSRFWFAVSLLAFLAMTPISRPVWHLLPILQNIQFPFRFHTILSVAITALFALAVHSVKEANARCKLFVRIVAISPILLFFLATALYGWRQYKIHDQLIYTGNDLVKNNLDAPEYWPRWADRNRFGLPDQQAFQISVVTGNAEVSVKSWQPGKIFFNITESKRATLDVHQLYFPGWQWRMAGEKVFRDAQPSPLFGLVRIEIPDGNYQLELRLNKTWSEQGGQIISAICCGFLILICLNHPRQ